MQGRIWSRVPQKENLPYIELEYIESTGTQYIDTGFTVGSEHYNTFIGFVDFEITGKSTGVYTMFGNGNYFMGYRNSDNALIWCSGGDMVVNSSILLDENRHTMLMNNARAQFYYDNKFLGTMQVFAYRNNTFLLFSYLGSSTTNFGARIYSAYICNGYDSDGIIKKVRDFIPCKMKNSGEVGLWDKISETFYPNAGDGEFIAGPKQQ